MKITVTTTIDTDTISEESSINTISTADLADLATWRNQTNQSEVDSMKALYDTQRVLLSPKIRTTYWTLKKKDRQMLINALLTVTDESDTNFVFGLASMTNAAGTDEHELEIIVQPNVNKDEFYILRPPGIPTGTLPTITPSPAL